MKSAGEPSLSVAMSSAAMLPHATNIAVDELTAKYNLLEKEHDLATNMPQDFLNATNRDSFGGDLHSFCVPMGKTCGDALEILRLDDDHLAIFLIDATGHGLAASQLAMLALQTLRSWWAADCHQLLQNPSEVLTKLNNLIYQANSRDCLFVAATYAVYNERTQSVRLARGGNPYPMLYRNDISPQQIESQGPLLGVIPDADFENIELQLTCGDQLAIFSDGLEDCGLADDLGMLLMANNDSFGVSSSSSLIDDQFAAFECRLTQQARAGQLLDDVSVAILQIPTTTTNEPDVSQTKPIEQLALA